MLCFDFKINSHQWTRFVLWTLKCFGSHLLLLTAFTALGSIAWSQPSNGADSGGNSSGFASSRLTQAASREPGNSMRVNGRRFSARNVSFMDLVAFGWNLHPTQIQGGPEWSHEERFDLIADASADSEPDVQQWRAMVRDLVGGRFRMKAHREKKLLDAFVLTLPGQSPQMKEDPTTQPDYPAFRLARANSPPAMRQWPTSRKPHSAPFSMVPFLIAQAFATNMISLLNGSPIQTMQESE